MSTLPSPTDAHDWPVGTRCACFTFIVVFLLGFFDFVDRQILASLFPYIKAEWQLTDTQLGGLVTVVNIAIAAMVVPSGLLADRWSRKKTLGCMAVVWSLATGACALAGNYAHLFIARAFIGAGEAGYGPTAGALIASSFPKRHRTFALATSNIGATLGIPVGLAAGAFIASHWGWRHAFGVVAIPGLIAAFGAFFIKDYKNVELKDGPDCPPPVQTEADDCVPPNKLSTMQAMGGLVKTPTLLLVYVGIALNMFFSGIMMNWLPSYLQRIGGMPVAQASGMSAVIFLLSILTMLLVGPPTDWLRKKLSNATTVIQACSIGLAGLLYLTGFRILTPGGTLQIVVLMAAFCCTGILSPLNNVSILDVVHPGLRSTAMAMQLFVQNVLGFALGPFIAGMVSDRYDLGTALTILSGVTFVSCLCYVAASLTYRRDMARAAVTDVSF